MEKQEQLFRIITQDVDPNQEDSLASGGIADYNTGHQCKGFCILADDGDGCSVFIHHVSLEKLSDMIEKSDKLLAASWIAQGKRKANEILMRRGVLQDLHKIIARDE